jgi:hypothetical protein
LTVDDRRHGLSEGNDDSAVAATDDGAAIAADGPGIVEKLKDRGAFRGVADETSLEIQVLPFAVVNAEGLPVMC